MLDNDGTNATEQPDDDLEPSTGDDQGDGQQDEGLLDELAGLDRDITVDDLRRMPGSKGLSNEQLTKLWEESKPKPAELPFPLFDEQGNKLTDPAKLSLMDLLAGKYQIGYTALGKEQRKALKDLVRNASLGHYNEHKMNSLQQERKQIADRYSQLDKEHEQWRGERGQWMQALEQAARGNDAALKKLVETYATAAPAGPAPETTDAQLEAAGMRFYYETIVPRADDVAKQYGAKPDEVRKAVEWLIQQEPAQFLTREKIESILTTDLPALLEQHGYAVRGSAPVPIAKPAGEEVADLRKQLQALTAKVENAATARAKTKRARAPGSGRGNLPGAGDSQPEFKSKEEAKEWLRNLQE